VNKIFLSFLFFFISLSFYAQVMFPTEEASSIFSTLYREGKYDEAILECEKEIASNANNIDVIKNINEITLLIIFIISTSWS